MELPTIRNVLVDQGRGVRFEVLAYRRLSEGELLRAVSVFLSQRKKPKLKRGMLVQIISTIGIRD